MNKLFLLPLLFLALMSSCAKSRENSENDESNSSGSSNSNASTAQINENGLKDSYSNAFEKLMSIGDGKQLKINSRNGELADTIAKFSGKYYGNNAKNTMKLREKQTPQYYNDFDEDIYLRGVEFVLMKDTADVSFILGMSDALTLYYEKFDFESQDDLPIDSRKLIKAYRDAYKEGKYTRHEFQEEAFALSNKLDLYRAERKEEKAEEMKK